MLSLWTNCMVAPGAGIWPAPIVACGRHGCLLPSLSGGVLQTLIPHWAVPSVLSLIRSWLFWIPSCTVLILCRSCCRPLLAGISFSLGLPPLLCPSCLLLLSVFHVSFHPLLLLATSYAFFLDKRAATAYVTAPEPAHLSRHSLAAFLP